MPLEETRDWPLGLGEIRQALIVEKVCAVGQAAPREGTVCQGAYRGFLASQHYDAKKRSIRFETPEDFGPCSALFSSPKTKNVCNKRIFTRPNSRFDALGLPLERQQLAATAPWPNSKNFGTILDPLIENLLGDSLALKNTTVVFDYFSGICIHKSDNKCMVNAENSILKILVFFEIFYC